MKSEVTGGPSFAHIRTVLDPGESLVAESDAMSSMGAGMDVKSRLNGGFFGAILRKFLGGESLFINEFSNPSGEPCDLILTQAFPGDILCADLNGDELFLQPGAFIACEPGVSLSLHWAGIVSFIAREGLFRLKVSGHGKAWYGAYGALLEREVDGETIVDSSHLVAYEPTVELKLQLAGGIFSSFFGGEGLVTRVTGRGRYIIQTRSLSGLASWLNPKF